MSILLWEGKLCDLIFCQFHVLSLYFRIWKFVLKRDLTQKKKKKCTLPAHEVGPSVEVFEDYRLQSPDYSRFGRAELKGIQGQLCLCSQSPLLKSDGLRGRLHNPPPTVSRLSKGPLRHSLPTFYAGFLAKSFSSKWRNQENKICWGPTSVMPQAEIWEVGKQMSGRKIERFNRQRGKLWPEVLC